MKIAMIGRAAVTAALMLVLVACSYGYDRPKFGMSVPLAAFSTRPVLAPPRPAMAALGAQLFSEARLSGSGDMSCATCHQAAKGFADGKPLSDAIGGGRLVRHTPTLYNVAYYPALFWDGRSPSLEDQALRPITSGVELGRHPAILADAVANETLYRPMFMAAFGTPDVTEDRIAQAIAAYERTLVSGVAPFDRWLAGGRKAIEPDAQRGFALFTGKAQCSACHTGWLLSDGKFHDTGLPDDDFGRGAITNNRWLDHTFKTPSLREIGRTAPYMHDGSLETLDAVVDHYADRKVSRKLVIPQIVLNPDERRDLVAFLKTLDSDIDGIAIMSANGAKR